MLWCIFVVSVLAPSIHAARILIVPSNGFSHCSDLAIVADVLVEHGHFVKMLISSAHPCDFQPDRKFEVSAIQVKMGRQHFADLVHGVIAEGMVNPWNVSAFGVSMKILSDLCEEMMEHGDAMISQLREEKYDLAILDDSSMCGILPVNQLNLPYVGISTMSFMVDNFSNTPMPPSYVPAGIMSPFPDKMTFFQRLTNAVICVLGKPFLGLMFGGVDALNVKYDVKPESSVLELFADFELILWNRDFTFEFPRPIMPNVIPYGSITTKPALPLSKELEDFMQSAENGVVVVSFGTFVTRLEGKILGRLPSIMASALSKLPQKVIWKFEGSVPDTLGSNTKLLPWLPLNDLLGHPKTRLFVNQAGIMGIYEAIYHGVPMLAVPFFGDQLSNAVRVEEKGMGTVLHFSDVTEESFYEAIVETIADNKYKSNMDRHSEIYRNRPMNSTETIAFWVDYVIKHGGQHLRSQARNLSFIQYYLIDVVGLVLLVTFVIMGILMWTCRKLCRFCRRPDKKLKMN